jgi:hypothetical protein
VARGFNTFQDCSSRQVQKFGCRGPETAEAAVGKSRKLRVDTHETLGLSIAKRSKQDGIDDAEDSGGGADA